MENISYITVHRAGEYNNLQAAQFLEDIQTVASRLDITHHTFLFKITSSTIGKCTNIGNWSLLNPLYSLCVRISTLSLI